MRKMKGIILMAIFGILLSSCSKMKAPEFRSIENFRIDSAGLVSSKVRLDVLLFNPNNFSVKLKETASNFYIDSTYLGQLTQDSVVSIAANSSFVVPLTGTVQVNKLLNNGLAILLNKKVLVRAEGNTKVGKAGLFINYPFHFQEMQSLDFLR
jgi:LEA14-like dessication related protein